MGALGGQGTMTMSVASPCGELVLLRGLASEAPCLTVGTQRWGLDIGLTRGRAGSPFSLVMPLAMHTCSCIFPCAHNTPKISCPLVQHIPHTICSVS